MASKGKSALEEALRLQMLEAKLPPFIAQAKLVPGRRFSWDFCFEAPYRLGIEVQGGLWMARGGHTSGQGVSRDCEKHNLATLAGWWTMAITAEHINTGQALEWITQFINQRSVACKKPKK
jgi:hypothetical protein